MTNVTSSDSREAAPDGPAGVEVEWQFDAPDLERVARWLKRGAGGGVRPLGTRELVDVYLDTSDWRFMRANRSLRLRQRADRAEATLKSLDEQPEGPRSRLEVTQELPLATIAALLAAAGAVTERVRAVAGSELLLERGHVRTERANFELTSGRLRRPVAIVSLDRTVFGEGDGARMMRVEVELAPGVSPDEVAPFVERLATACELTRAHGSKFEHAVRQSDTPPVPATAPATPAPGANFGEVAAAAVAAQLHALHAREPAARLGDDPEGVHDVRVGTRRLRAALALLGEALSGDLGALREELRWIASCLGGVRDLDVLRQELERREASGPALRKEALAPLHAILAHEHEDARRELLAALDSDRYAALIASLGMLLESAAPTPAAAIEGRAQAAVLLRAAHRKFRSDAERANLEAPEGAWHQLRIRGKRLRYAIEFFAPVLGRPAEPALLTLKDVQNVLGELQDAAVMTARLTAIAERESLPAPTVFALGEWAGARAAGALALRAEFPELLDRFGGDWRRLRTALARRGAHRRRRQRR